MILFDDLLAGENDFSYRGAVGAEVRKIIFTRKQVIKQSFHYIMWHILPNRKDSFERNQKVTWAQNMALTKLATYFTTRTAN